MNTSRLNIRLLYIATLALSFVISGCGSEFAPIAQKTVVNPAFNYLSDANSEGGQSAVAVSPTRALKFQALGGSTLRTSSSSQSFKMVSGVGVN